MEGGGRGSGRIFGVWTEVKWESLCEWWRGSGSGLCKLKESRRVHM